MGIRINRNLCIVVSLAGILSASAMLLAQTKPAAPDAPPPELQTFAIIYQPGPNWIAGKSIFEQDLMEHGQYMAKLLDQGTLELGGPFSDSTGGMAIITVKDEDAAKAVMANDPGLNKGIFKATLRPWEIVFRKPAK